MGIDHHLFWVLVDTLGARFGTWSDIRLCELGNQEISKSALEALLQVGYKPDVGDWLRLLKDLPHTPAARVTTAKKVFSWLGANHTSFDLNGEDGAVPVDLSEPMQLTSMWMNACDVVTNFGTSEHVGEGEPTAWPDAQHAAFQNMHDFARPGALFLHALPLKNCWLGHGGFDYEPIFFSALADAAGYQVLHLSVYYPSYAWSSTVEEYALAAFESLGVPRTAIAMAGTHSVHEPSEAVYPERAMLLAVLARSTTEHFIDRDAFAALPGIAPRSSYIDNSDRDAAACGAHTVRWAT
eukprot:TRINITY_DN29586_c0_g1_i1.p1 TRINITY_DN29586_c0_g1~~TRINITY_DN29586_c0_g1_i1.p1  ORF type:complete len:296 (-),score=34.64 TRINITY_DN29586_c0_g1_i1:735-1622(-)